MATNMDLSLSEHIFVDAIAQFRRQLEKPEQIVGLFRIPSAFGRCSVQCRVRKKRHACWSRFPNLGVCCLRICVLFMELEALCVAGAAHGRSETKLKARGIRSMDTKTGTLCVQRRTRACLPNVFLFRVTT